MVPVAHANDGGGSIRLPAAWCGLVGLKPSRGRVSDPLDMRSLAELVVSRSVRDAAAVLDAVHGSEPGDLFLVPLPASSYAAEVGADPGKLRIGILTRTYFGEVHPECLAAIATTAKLLESLGHRVEESFPEALFDPDQEKRLGPLNRAAGHWMMLGLGEALGRAVTRDDVEPFSWLVALAAEQPPVVFEEYLKAMGWLNQWVRRVARWWSTGFDLLLTPTVWEPPATLVEMTPSEDEPGRLLSKIRQHVFFTSPFNLTGQPAISLPLHWTPEGLPVGVQLVAAIGREDLLIRVASQLEQARPWIDRRPPVHGRT
jgi:amidase